MAALPTGVEIRGNSVCIWFMYRGKRCREILRGWNNTPANIKKAGNLRALVLSEINMGEFDYQTRFPSSKKRQNSSLRFQSERWVNSAICGCR